MAKLYQSKKWLTLEYTVRKKTAAVIAAEQGVSEMTIVRYLHEFGLKKRPRPTRKRS